MKVQCEIKSMHVTSCKQYIRIILFMTSLLLELFMREKSHQKNETPCSTCKKVY